MYLKCYYYAKIQIMKMKTFTLKEIENCANSLHVYAILWFHFVAHWIKMFRKAFPFVSKLVLELFLKTRFFIFIFFSHIAQCKTVLVKPFGLIRYWKETINKWKVNDLHKHDGYSLTRYVNVKVHMLVLRRFSFLGINHMHI